MSNNQKERKIPVLITPKHLEFTIGALFEHINEHIPPSEEELKEYQDLVKNLGQQLNGTLKIVNDDENLQDLAKEMGYNIYNNNFHLKLCTDEKDEIRFEIFKLYKRLSHKQYDKLFEITNTKKERI
jgi:predicted nucleic acid-binding protein